MISKHLSNDSFKIWENVWSKRNHTIRLIRTRSYLRNDAFRVARSSDGGQIRYRNEHEQGLALRMLSCPSEWLFCTRNRNAGPISRFYSKLYAYVSSLAISHPRPRLRSQSQSYATQIGSVKSRTRTIPYTDDILRSFHVFTRANSRRPSITRFIFIFHSSYIFYYLCMFFNFIFVSYAVSIYLRYEFYIAFGFDFNTQFPVQLP